MGLAKTWTINWIEPLSGDPLSGFDCTEQLSANLEIIQITDLSYVDIET